MHTALGGREQPAPASSSEDLDTYQAAADHIRACLDLGDEAAANGDLARAAEYLLGVISDLAPELQRLSAHIHP